MPILPGKKTTKRGEGVKNRRFFDDIVYGWRDGPLAYFSLWTGEKSNDCDFQLPGALVTHASANLSKWFLKFIYSEKATKIFKISTVDLTGYNIGQIYGRDFAKFCDLLRIYEI